MWLNIIVINKNILKQAQEMCERIIISAQVFMFNKQLSFDTNYDNDNEVHLCKIIQYILQEK